MRLGIFTFLYPSKIEFFCLYAEGCVMSTAEAAAKIFEEIAQLFGSCPTDKQVLEFRPSPDVSQRASQLLQLNRTGKMDDDLRHELDQYEHAELLMRMVKAQIRARHKSGSP